MSNTNEKENRRYKINGRKMVGALLTLVALAVLVIVVAVALKELGVISANAQTETAGTQSAPPAGTVASQPIDAVKTPGATSGNIAGSYLVVVDAGHGGFDPGCIGVTGTHEADINLQIAQYLKTEFEAQGVQVLMTREDDVGLGTTQIESLHERGRIISESGADLAISIHMNSYPDDPNVHGPLVLFMAGSEKGKTFAGKIQDALNDELNADGKERSQELYVLKQGNQPSVLVECGYLSNTDEERSLQQAEYQQRVARAICEGAMAFLSEQ